MKNLDKYKEDLKKLILNGDLLNLAMQYECHPVEFEKSFKKQVGDDYEKYIKNLKSFGSQYQSWYSESLTLVKQLLPHRVADFVKYYEKSKTRKTIEYGNYVIEDYLQNLTVKSNFGEIKVSPSAAYHQFEQQLLILKAVEKRFESSLFDIRQLTLADVFDSELDAAKELNKKGFGRGAGAICGVILEKHLSQVCENHNLNLTKKHPTIADLNDRLKNEDIYETPTWRKIQHLGDLRNLCDHNKEKEPTKEEVEELIVGVDKVIKTIY
jgi:hypothetical protein